MKVLVLYRPDSEHARGVEEYLREFQRRNPGIKLNTLSVDTREGSATAALYDIVQYPAILATRDDGSVQQIWSDGKLPLMDEVASYAAM